MSRWYGLGGSCIDVGSPHYIVLDLKPESEMEVQNISCGSSGIMLGLKLVKMAEETARTESDTNMNQGTNVLVELARAWADKQRIVCDDNHFASVQAAQPLLEIDLRFTGVVKTATMRFLTGFFNRHPFLKKGRTPPW